MAEVEVTTHSVQGDDIVSTKETIRTPKPIKRRKATLDDIKPVYLDVIIEDSEENEDGEVEPVELEFRMKVPSFFRWNQIGAEVVDPPMETIGADKNNRPIYDTNSPRYRSALNDAANERHIRRLAEALEVPAIPGESLAEKARFIQDNMPPGIVQNLCGLLNVAAAKGGEARISSRANSFQ